MDEAIVSLENHDLLNTCTYRGETTDWENFTDYGIKVSGKIQLQRMSKDISKIILFLVDMSGFGISKIDRINTWLTCETQCWTALGSNNPYLNPANPDKFRIFIRKTDDHNPEQGVDVIKAAEWNFVLHYEVEGTCS